MNEYTYFRFKIKQTNSRRDYKNPIFFNLLSSSNCGIIQDYSDFPGEINTRYS